MSAVKNLRAMFEQKGETSPPDRGRSPGIPHRPGDSPRPLSKIRTSFIAIEKDGRMGIQREGSQDSISALRKQSGDSNVTTPVTGNEGPNPFGMLTKSPARMGLQTQAIARSPQADAESKDAAPSVLVEKKITKAEPVPGPDAGSKEPAPNGGTKSPGSSSGSTTPKAKETNGTGSGQDPPKAKANETSKPGTRTTKPVPTPLPAPSANKSTSKPENSPAAHKGLRTPAMTSTHYPVVKTTPEKKAQPPEKPVTPRATATPKPAGPSSVNKPPSLQPSPSTGFVKPRVKSPTRPVKLPPGLTTHTASSGSKINAPRQSLSRASGATLPADSHGRPASRASASTAGSAAHKPASTKGLKRQSSTVNRPRPSLGLPPKQPAKDHPPTKKEKEIDQGFLARMMRPTAASASKTTEKVQTTPPWKPASVPKKPAAAVKPVKKAAGTPSLARSKPFSADQTAAGAEHATAAGEVAEPAETAEAEASLPSEVNPKISTGKAAPAAVQGETADQDVTAAQKAGDEAALLQASDAAAAEGSKENAKAKVEGVAEESIADVDIEKRDAAVAEHHETEGAAADAGTEEKSENGEDSTVV